MIDYTYVFTFQLFVVLPYLLRSEIHFLHQTLDPIKPSIAFDTRDGCYKPLPPTVQLEMVLWHRIDRVRLIAYLDLCVVALTESPPTMRETLEHHDHQHE